MDGRPIPNGGDFLSAFEVAALDPTELTRRTTALGELVRTSAAEAERLRRPVADVWSAIRSSGLFYQFVPRSRGGMGVDTDSFIDAAPPIAMADPATAWSACFCAGHNRTLAHFPVEAQQEIWGGDYPYIVARSLSSPPAQATRVHGRYRISGSWGWGSGIMDADWVLGVVMVNEEGAEPQLAVAAFPAADASVTDTWNMDGLAASGSNDVAVIDLFIPEHRMLTDFEIFSGDTVGAREYPEPVFHITLTAFPGLSRSYQYWVQQRGGRIYGRFLSE